MDKYKIKLIATPNNLTKYYKLSLNILDNEIFNVYGDKICNKEKSWWWIAFYGKRQIGFAGLEKIKNEGFLIRSGVSKYFRGLGLQKRLIRTRIKKCKNLGIRKIITYTSYENIISANNLIKCGFKLYSPEKKYGLKNSLYFKMEI